MSIEKEMKDIGGFLDAVIGGVKPEADFWKSLAEGPSVLSGLRDVDACLYGFWPGDLVVVASGPTVGRSSFASQMALNAALSGASVELYSLEYDAKTAVARMIACEARLSLGRLLGGFATEGDILALSDVREQLPTLDLSICDDYDLTIDELEKRVLGGDAGAGKRLVVVDGPERLAGGNGKAELDEMAGRLKLLARKIEAPVIMTVGVRGKDARRIRRKKSWFGSIMDLLGGVADAADVVLMLDRSLTDLEAESMFGAPPINVARLIVAKNRRGCQRDITLAFVARYMRFMDYMDDSYL